MKGVLIKQSCSLVNQHERYGMFVGWMVMIARGQEGLWHIYTSKTKHFQGHFQILFLSTTSFFSGCVRVQQFHFVPREENANWGLFFQFTSVSDIVPNFWKADYSASRLLLLVPCSGLSNYEDGGKCSSET
jgi:hypothetical protein